MPVLATGADELNVAGICSDLKYWSTTIQLTFGRHGSRPPVSAFAGNVNVGEVADNFMAIC